MELSDLVNEPWVLPPFDSVPGRLIAEIFAANKLQVPLASVVNLSIHLTTALVATGRSIALLPGSVARFSADRLSLKILPVKMPAQRITVGIVTVKNRTISALAQLFIDCARKVALPLTD